MKNNLFYYGSLLYAMSIFLIGGLSVKAQSLLYDNGSVFNIAGPPQVSMLQDASLGMDSYGFNIAKVNSYSIADDFTLTNESTIDYINAFVYQTGANAATITGIYIKIWNGNPSSGGTVVWGDFTTNRLGSAVLSGGFRQLESTPGDTSRKIQTVRGNTPGLSLMPGTYWIEYTLEGTGASGPWAPPVTITGNSTTGNALQFTGSYAPLLDSGTNTPQGLPFQIYGDEVAGGPFPAPYCVVSGLSSVEPITRVIVADIDNTSPNLSSAPRHEDFTSVIGHMVQGTSYELKVEGNTSGNFTTSVHVYVDWNNDGDFMDAGEYFYGGTLVNSTGSDGKQAIGNIVVPADAAVGNKRMRIIKRFQDVVPNPNDGCTGGSSFGQAEDYTIAVTEGGGTGTGETCETALVVSSLPYDHAGNTADYGNDYSNGDVPPLAPGAITTGTGSPYYLSGDDVVYAYTPLEDEVLNISTTNDDDWVGLWAFTGCPFTSTVGYHTATSGATRMISGLPVIAGTTYYFVISTWPSPQSTNYTIHIEKVGGEEPGGDCNFEHILVGDADGGSGSSVDSDYKSAADILVPAGQDFTLETIYVPFLTFAPEDAPTTAKVVYYSDASGLPGAQIGTETVVPTILSSGPWINPIAFEFETQLDMTPFTFQGDATNDTSYWIEISMGTATNQATVFWMYTQGAGIVGKPMAQFNAGDGTWTFPEATREVVYNFDGECVPMGGGSDVDCDQGDDSNAFENGYNITAGGTFRNADDFFVSAGNTLNVQQIELNVFASEPIATMDFIFYEDNGSGAPSATIVETLTNVAVESVAIGSQFGYTIYAVFADVNLSFTEGAYWMQPAAHVGTAFWEVSSLGTLGSYIHTSESNGPWIADEDMSHGVFKLHCVAVDPPEEQCLLGFDYVEAITRVIVADIDNTSPAVSTIEWEDFTSIEGHVAAGESYPIALEGNTAGNWTNYFTVWVDWNQNGTYEGSEMYQIGSITNSNGTDGQQATGTIAVPAGAAEGSTTMRVIKSYGSSPTDPCGNYSFGQAEEYTIIVGEVTPPEDCTFEHTTTGDGNGGSGSSVDSEYKSAVDLVIPAGEVFTLHTIKVPFLTFAPEDAPVTAHVVYYEDDNGFPGMEMGDETVVPTILSSGPWINPVAFVFETELTMTPYTFNGDSGSDKTYWVEISMGTATNQGTVFWLYTDGEGLEGQPLVQFNPADGWTIPEGTREGVYSFLGQCSTLGVSDMSTFDFAYYPNPVKDVLNIKSERAVKSVEAFNLTGQKVISDAKVLNGQINVNALTAGTYVFRVTLEDGQVETFKIIKK